MSHFISFQQTITNDNSSVLQELDKLKNGDDSKAYDVRQAAQFLNSEVSYSLSFFFRIFAPSLSHLPSLLLVSLSVDSSTDIKG